MARSLWHSHLSARIPAQQIGHIIRSCAMPPGIVHGIAAWRSPRSGTLQSCPPYSTWTGAFHTYNSLWDIWSHGIIESPDSDSLSCWRMYESSQRRFLRVRLTRLFCLRRASRYFRRPRIHPNALIPRSMNGVLVSCVDILASEHTQSKLQLFPDVLEELVHRVKQLTIEVRCLELVKK